MEKPGTVMGSYNCGAIRGKGGRIVGYQPSTRLSKRPCLKGIKWKVIAQDPQRPPVPLPCVHMCSKMRDGQSAKALQWGQVDGINATRVQ